MGTLCCEADKTARHVARHRPSGRGASELEEETMGSSPGVTAARRWGIAARSALAVLGGYAVAALVAASLSLALPMPRPQAVLTATMLAFIVYCAVVIWAFCAASVRRACCGAMLLGTVPACHLALRWAAP